jgi:hypothetical protein
MNEEQRPAVEPEPAPATIEVQPAEPPLPQRPPNRHQRRRASALARKRAKERRRAR